MGSFKIVEAALEPVTNFVRYLPVSALIPLLILWVGIDIEEKISVIFIGTFFQQLILIADVSRGVSQDLLDVSYTLGANRRTVVARVLIPATLPGVMDTLRVTLGWAWTYLVVAELVAANKGLGYFILNSMRGLFTDQIFLGIMVIGLLGLITDQVFKLLRNWLLPWATGRRQLIASAAKLRIDNVALRFRSRSGRAGHRAGEHLARCRGQGVLGHRRTVGLRQDQPAAARRRPDRADRRRDLARRHARQRARQGPRHGVPVLHAVSLADRAATTWSSGCASRGIPAAQRREIARRFIAQVGLNGFERHYPKQLSGGMMQRVALARALANDPAILLMDEPFGALDSQTRSLMQELLLDIWQHSHKTVLFITHDIDEAILLGDRVYVMTARPGRIKEMVRDRSAAAAHRRHADQRRIHGDQAAHHAFDPRGGDAKRRDLSAPIRDTLQMRRIRRKCCNLVPMCNNQGVGPAVRCRIQERCSVWRKASCV